MKHHRIFLKDAGFTIVEVLVVLAIVAIISGFMVVNFRKGGESGKLQRSAQLIVQNIRKAQNMALSSVEYGGAVPYAYGVFFDRDVINSYILFADLNPDSYRYNGEPPDKRIETINLERGIVIDSISPSPFLHIAFSPPNPLTFINVDRSEATITIKKEGATCPSVNCRNITVKNTGWMTIK